MLELYFWGNASATSLPPTLYKDRTNFRIVKVFVGAKSYMAAQQQEVRLL